MALSLVAWGVRKGFPDKAVLRGILRGESGGDLEEQVLLTRGYFGLYAQGYGGSKEGFRRVVWSGLHFLFSVLVVGTEHGSQRAVPGPAASPSGFLAMQIHGPCSDLLNQIPEDGPETGLEQALLVMSVHVKAGEPLL